MCDRVWRHLVQKYVLHKIVHNNKKIQRRESRGYPLYTSIILYFHMWNTTLLYFYIFIHIIFNQYISVFNYFVFTKLFDYSLRLINEYTNYLSTHYGMIKYLLSFIHIRIPRSEK